jgi:hypothetical protein
MLEELGKLLVKAEYKLSELEYEYENQGEEASLSELARLEGEICDAEIEVQSIKNVIRIVRYKLV